MESHTTLMHRKESLKSRSILRDSLKTASPSSVVSIFRYFNFSGSGKQTVVARDIGAFYIEWVHELYANRTIL